MIGHFFRRKKHPLLFLSCLVTSTRGDADDLPRAPPLPNVASSPARTPPHERYHEFLARYAAELQTLAAGVGWKAESLEKTAGKGPEEVLLGSSSLVETPPPSASLVETGRILERYAEHIKAEAARSAQYWRESRELPGSLLEQEVSESDIVSEDAPPRQHAFQHHAASLIQKTRKQLSLIHCGDKHVPWWTEGTAPTEKEIADACSHHEAHHGHGTGQTPTPPAGGTPQGEHGNKHPGFGHLSEIDCKGRAIRWFTAGPTPTEEEKKEACARVDKPSDMECEKKMFSVGTGKS